MSQLEFLFQWKGYSMEYVEYVQASHIGHTHYVNRSEW